MFMTSPPRVERQGWVLRSYETIKITNAINQKKQSIGFKGEMHFKEINKGNLDTYCELLNAIIENSSSISIKGIGVLRSGLRIVLSLAVASA